MPTSPTHPQLTSSGLSFCLSTWVMPLILSTDPRTQSRQLIQTVDQGGRYLQPTSRMLGLALLSITAVLFVYPDPACPTRWRHYATALCILAPIAPYEVYAIFPINGRMKEIGGQLEARHGGDPWDEKEVKELGELLRAWQVRNFGRILPPLVASFVGLWSIYQSQQ